MFSKKATKIDKIFTVDLTLCRKCQIDHEDLINFLAFWEKTNFNIKIKLNIYLGFCALLRKPQLHLASAKNET